MNACVLVIDQGTTSSRAMVFDGQGQVIATAQKKHQQHYPRLGWVEHDPEEIWSNVLTVCHKVLQSSKVDLADIVAMGLTNQRETTLVWDKKTGEVIYPAIVWQDRRTADLCDQLSTDDVALQVKQKTGLLLDPYFSATKIAWILSHVEGARAKAKRGELLFGTIDSFLIFRLTQGKRHVTDVTNASRTLLFDIVKQDWDDDLLMLFDIPRSMLPQVLNNCDDFGEVDPSFLGKRLPIAGVAGDQQAAAIGQACFSAGMAKSTYGTGSFILMNTGETPVYSTHRLLTTILYRINGLTHYALEGSIFNAGTVVEWMRDELHFFKELTQTSTIAAAVDMKHGVYFVPAFTGLGAPYWLPNVRGGILGLTRGTGFREIVRAGLEAVCYQTKDLLDAMIADGGLTLTTLRADGGMALNPWVMQHLADMLNIQVEVPMSVETTAAGAAILASLQMGMIDSLETAHKRWQRKEVFSPSMTEKERNVLYTGWQRAIRQVCAE